MTNRSSTPVIPTCAILDQDKDEARDVQPWELLVEQVVEFGFEVIVRSLGVDDWSDGNQQQDCEGQQHPAWGQGSHRISYPWFRSPMIEMR